MDLSMHTKSFSCLLEAGDLDEQLLEWTQRRTQGRSSSYSIKPVNRPFGSNLNSSTALCYTEIMLLIMVIKAKSLLMGDLVLLHLSTVLYWSDTRNVLLCRIYHHHHHLKFHILQL